MSVENPAKPLNPKQTLFVSEYLIDFNAAAAARRAGYSAKSARTIGAKLLTNVDIQTAIRTAQNQRAQTNEITAQRVLDELASIAFSDIGQVIDFKNHFKLIAEMPESARRAIASIKVRQVLGGENQPPAEVLEFKLWDKIEALTKLALHLGLFKKDEADGGITVRLVHRIVTKRAEIDTQPDLTLPDEGTVS